MILLRALVGFLIGFLLSLSMDSIAYFIKYIPSDNVSYSQYFKSSELLYCAVMVGIMTLAVATCITFNWSQKNESTTN